jgi:hypothetical protein
VGACVRGTGVFLLRKLRSEDLRTSTLRYATKGKTDMLDSHRFTAAFNVIQGSLDCYLMLVLSRPLDTGQLLAFMCVAVYTLILEYRGGGLHVCGGVRFFRDLRMQR